MNVFVYSTKSYDRTFLEQENAGFGHALTFLEARLNSKTAQLVDGHEAVCAFVNDELDAATFEVLAARGVRLVALRCAGFNNVDLDAAARLKITIARVPAYSPHAVAEHTIALLLALNRKVHRAYNRVRDGNFSLDGLLGFDINGLTAGVIGTGKIGRIVARILMGFGCHVLVHDPYPDAEFAETGPRYVPRDELLASSDIITLHCPLTPATHHMIDAEALTRMKRGATLINTSRGALVDAKAVVEALKSGSLGFLGLDVYEEEADLFFEDLSGKVIQDDVFARLTTFPNVIITGHQAFFTRNALENIARTTCENVREFEETGACTNEVTTALRSR